MANDLVVAHSPKAERWASLELSLAWSCAPKTNARALLLSDSIYATPADQEQAVRARMMRDNVGLMQITIEPSPEYADIRGQVAEALDRFSGTRGVILDLRRSIGGDDRTCVLVANLFATQPGFLYRVEVNGPLRTGC